MSYPDPPRRPRYPALAQYENDYPSQRGGYAQEAPAQATWGRPATPPQAPAPQPAPWEEETRVQWAEPVQAPWDKPTRASRVQPTTPPWDVDGSPDTGQFDLGNREGRVDRSGPADLRGATDRTGPVRRAHGRERAERSRGLLAGAVTGFLSAALAIGVANLVAAFIRPQASPIIAVGEAFIDRTPSALKNFAVQKFGENDKNMLLLGMYVSIAIIAIVIGMVAWRHVSAGVAGIGAFGLFGAFVAITRPESHATDVIPSIVGGIAGITAIVWLVQIGTRRNRYRATAEGDF